MSAYTRMPDFSKIPLAHPPPGVIPNLVNPHSDIWQFTITSTLGNFLVLVCLSLRLYTRIILVRTSGFEDFFLVIAFLLGVANNVAGNEMGRFGMGIHSWNVPLTHFSKFLLLQFITILCYVVQLMLVKLAILGLLIRLNPKPSFRYLCYGTVFIVIGSTIGAIVSLLLRCDPVSDQWSINNPHCKNNLLTWVIATGCVNIITDFLMLALPIPMLWTVILPRRQKIGVALVIMTGSMVGFLSIARLVLLVPALSDPDATYSTLKVAILSHLEGQVAVICACLPTLKPFFRKHLKFVFGSGEDATASSYTQFSQANKHVVSKVDANGKITLTAIRKPGSRGAGKVDIVSSISSPKGFVERHEFMDEEK